MEGVSSSTGDHGNTIGGTAAGAGNVIEGKISLLGNADLLEGNLIGTDATRSVANRQRPRRRGKSTGLATRSAAPRSRPANVVVGGLSILGGFTPDSTGNLIEGDDFGTDITGTKVLGGAGLALLATSNNTIGGTAPGAGNVIVGVFAGSGIEIGDGFTSRATSGNLIQGNFIGTDATGTRDFHSGGAGITIDSSTGDKDVSDNTIGGTAAGAGNVIAYNPGGGVAVRASSPGNSVLGNSIFADDANGVRLGIELAGTGAAPIKPGAPNNRPELTTRFTAAGTTTVAGTLNGTPMTAYTLEFFASVQGSITGFGEGQTYLGDATVTTNSAGVAGFSLPITTPIAGQVLSATSTDPAGTTSRVLRHLEDRRHLVRPVGHSDDAPPPL